MIYQQHFFLPTVEPRPSSRQIFSLLISKGNLGDSNFAQLRQLLVNFSLRQSRNAFSAKTKKDRQHPIAQGVRAGRLCAFLCSSEHTHRPAEVDGM
jgi:hypothetical protein